jgi:hypothetical protein
MAAAAVAALTLGSEKVAVVTRERRGGDQSELRRHLENLEDALAAMIELWRSGQARCIDASNLQALERVRDDPLMEVAAQEEETNRRAGAKGTGTVEKGNKLA